MRWIFDKRETLEGEYRRGLGNGYILGIVSVLFLVLLFICLISKV